MIFGCLMVSERICDFTYTHVADLHENFDFSLGISLAKLTTVPLELNTLHRVGFACISVRGK